MANLGKEYRWVLDLVFQSSAGRVAVHVQYNQNPGLGVRCEEALRSFCLVAIAAHLKTELPSSRISHGSQQTLRDGSLTLSCSGRKCASHSAWMPSTSHSQSCLAVIAMTNKGRRHARGMPRASSR